MTKLRTLFSACLCCLLLVILINACKKNEEVKQPPTPAGLISEAKAFFTEHTLKDEPLNLNSANPVHNLTKKPVWEKATIRKISLGYAVIVPIKYDEKMYLKTGKGDALLSIEETSYMMIYDDAKGNKQVERVTLMPYQSTKDNTIEFTGIIAIEDWQGNFKKGYAIGKGGKAARVKLSERVNFSKANYSRTVTCWSFTWYGQNYSSGCECWSDIYVISSETFCFSDEGDVSEEVDGPGNGGDSGGGGTSGGDYTPPPPASVPTVLDSLNKIMKPSSCLNISQMQNLVTTFGSYLSGEGNATWACVQKAVYRKVEASGKKIEFCINGQIEGSGAYSPITGNFLWKDSTYISNATVFRHEFFHVYQDAHYAGGTAQYNTGNRTGYPNIEFEQALFNDILIGSEDAMGMGSSAPLNIVIEYRNWISTITNSNTQYPKQFSAFGYDANNVNKYYYFLNLFYQHSLYVGIGAINNTLQPSALLNIFSTSNCK